MLALLRSSRFVLWILFHVCSGSDPFYLCKTGNATRARLAIFLAPSLVRLIQIASPPDFDSQSCLLQARVAIVAPTSITRAPPFASSALLVSCSNSRTYATRPNRLPTRFSHEFQTGTFANTLGSSACTNCTAGSAATSQASQSCSLCPQVPWKASFDFEVASCPDLTRVISTGQILALRRCVNLQGLRHWLVPGTDWPIVLLR